MNWQWVIYNTIFFWSELESNSAHGSALGKCSHSLLLYLDIFHTRKKPSPFSPSDDIFDLLQRRLEGLFLLGNILIYICIRKNGYLCMFVYLYSSHRDHSFFFKPEIWRIFHEMAKSLRLQRLTYLHTYARNETYIYVITDLNHKHEHETFAACKWVYMRFKKILKIYKINRNSSNFISKISFIVEVLVFIWVLCTVLKTIRCEDLEFYIVFTILKVQLMHNVNIFY